MSFNISFFIKCLIENYFNFFKFFNQMMKRLLIFLNFFFYFSEASKIKSNDRWFIDEYNRVRLFHGINAVQKGFPWIPNSGHIDLTNQTQLDDFQKWGFNVVRLGFMWTGVMPEYKYINQTYINEMIKIIDNLQSRGIYVIIDMHQDELSSKFGSYDGAPRWLVDQMPNVTHPFPWPFSPLQIQTNGQIGFLSEDVGRTYQNLYDNVNQFQDFFAQYWSLVTQACKNYTNVLGYEIINEPWPGDIWSNPQLLLPGIAGQLNLLPLYDNIHETIRQYDKETLIFYEPLTWGNLFNSSTFGTGFSRAPMNDSSGTVLSWHYYCWVFALTWNPKWPNGTYPDDQKFFCHQVQQKLVFQAIVDTRDHLKSPSFLTEFGGCAYYFNVNNKTVFNAEECEYILNSADRGFDSWTYWNSDFYDSNFHYDFNLINLFARIYPVATSGIPITFDYDLNSKIFEYSFNIDFKIQQPTEIFIPQDLYQNFNVSVSNNLDWTFNAKTSLLLLSPISDSSSIGTVRISSL